MRTPPTFPPDTGCGRLVYAMDPPRLYYHTAQGESVWRVYDCVFEAGRLQSVGMPPKDRATRRVFVAATGVRKVYRRLPGEVWRATPSSFDRQLLAAEFLATSVFNPLERTAR